MKNVDIASICEAYMWKNSIQFSLDISLGVFITEALFLDTGVVSDCRIYTSLELLDNFID